MSTGLSNNPGRPSDNRARLTAVLLAVTIGAMLLLNFFWGRNLKQSRDIAKSNKAKVDQIEGALTEAEERNRETSTTLSAIQERLNAGQSVSADQLEAILSRIRQLEEDGVSHKADFDAVSRQASAIEDSFAINRTKIIEAATKCESVLAELAAMKTDIETWTKTIQPLPRGDSGKRIAKFPDLIEKYQTVMANDVVTMERHDIWYEQVQAIYPRVKLAYDSKDNSVVVNDDTVRFLHTLHAQVRDVRAELTRQQRAIEGIIAAAGDTDPSEQELQEALNEIERARGLTRLDDAVRQRREAEQRVDDMYAEQFAIEHGKKREALNAQKLKKMEEATLREQLGLSKFERQVHDLQKQLALKRLREEFARDRAIIDSLLAPFMDFAITQPGANGMTKGGIQRPVSLGALQSSGALTDSRQGLDTLYQFGGHPANLRKKGSFPSFVSMSPIRDENTRQSVRRAQQLLVKYGELMVMEGLLES